MSASTSNIEPTIRELQEELYCVKDRCQDIGIQLGLDDDALRQIEECYPDSSNQLRHVLRLWLGKGDASWSKLVTVLRHPVIDEKEMADKLESKYCPVLKASPAPSQECIVLEDPPTPDNAPSSSTTANDEVSTLCTTWFPSVGCMHALLIFLFGAELGYGSGVHTDWLVSCIQWKMNWYMD